ncbi:hypothetical protein GGF32_005917 [Allomyces javanicus]|nr:hypothetical protein GGF32_005917 [Allomyces javanicus]
MMMTRETIKAEDQLIDFNSLRRSRRQRPPALAQQEQRPFYKSVMPAIATKQWLVTVRKTDLVNEYNTTATLDLMQYAADPAHAAVLAKYLLEIERLQVFALAAGTNSVLAFPNGGLAVSKRLPYSLKVLSHDAHAIRTLDRFVFQHFINRGRGVLVVSSAPTREQTSQIPVLHVLDLPDPIAAMRKAAFEQGKDGVYLVPFAVPSRFVLAKFTTSAAHPAGCDCRGERWWRAGWSGYGGNLTVGRVRRRVTVVRPCAPSMRR